MPSFQAAARTTAAPTAKITTPAVGEVIRWKRRLSFSAYFLLVTISAARMPAEKSSRNAGIWWERKKRTASSGNGGKTLIVSLTNVTSGPAELRTMNSQPTATTASTGAQVTQAPAKR